MMQWVTLQEAAKRLGISASRVLKLRVDGRKLAFKFFRSWKVNEADLLLPLEYCKLDKKECPCCGEIFVPKRPNQIYCLPRCKGVQYEREKEQRRQLKKQLKKQCRFCGEVIRATGINRVFCSPECCELEKKKIKRQSRKCCQLCGKIFIPYLKKRVFCSPECNDLAHPEKVVRFNVFNRDNFICQYCGKNPTRDKVRLHLDEVIPRSRGGLVTMDNCVTACEQCNIQKKDHLLKYPALFKLRLKRVQEKNGEFERNEAVAVAGNAATGAS